MDAVKQYHYELCKDKTKFRYDKMIEIMDTYKIYKYIGNGELLEVNFEGEGHIDFPKNMLIDSKKIKYKFVQMLQELLKRCDSWYTIASHIDWIDAGCKDIDEKLEMIDDALLKQNSKDMYLILNHDSDIVSAIILKHEDDNIIVDNVITKYRELVNPLLNYVILFNEYNLCHYQDQYKLEKIVIPSNDYTDEYVMIYLGSGFKVVTK